MKLLLGLLLAVLIISFINKAPYFSAICSILGFPTHQHVFWETHGTTGSKKVFTAIPLADPSLNPREPWEDHVTVYKEWTASEAQGLATTLAE